MKHRWAALSTGALFAATLLTGCAGAGLIVALLTLMQVGDIVGNVSDLFEDDDNPGEFTVLLDGQVLPVTPASNGSLVLSGLPEGRHLLQVVAPIKRRGGVTIIQVQPDTRVNIPPLTEVVGGRILGKVQLGNGLGSYTPGRRILVVAIPGGAPLVEKGKAAPIPVPYPTTYYAAFTDANGNYALDAVELGDYLVTAAMAGHDCDVKAITLAGVGATPRADLNLERNTAVPSGVLTGSVSGAIAGGSQTLAGARIGIRPPADFEPVVPQAVIDAIATASGRDLMDSPWFAWDELATLTDAGGGYQSRAPVGENRLSCFAYGYRAAYLDAQVLDDGSVHSQFNLQRQ